ncbi:Ubiquitin-conjugating enzyme E2 R2 [Hypsibius exemplaris]|uniref:Ubiquitin-conjugating enzyme E2 R2 n=1 Tax=Hypsibius exemplaris TaxID=2072580 RepID=A0A1W0XFW7_HYPEX|nr:Ubiquitin-conjugating enzyme E2 R2 [Hypsibius exemplaris]
MGSTGNQHAVRVLMQEFTALQKEPIEGFRCKLLKDDNLFEWEVGIFGVPETIYQGGYFRASMKFPPEYPFSPPTVRFLTKLWHPNIYENGTVCISILHPPTDDPRSGELPSERWNPTQNVHSILMSIISLLNEPNTSSPANVDASIMYRRWKEKGDKDYERMVKEQVETSKADAARDNVIIPQTVEEYCVKRKKDTSVDLSANLSEFYDDDDDQVEDDDAGSYTYSDDEEPSSPGGAENSLAVKRKEDDKAADLHSTSTEQQASKRPKPDSPPCPDRT